MAQYKITNDQLKMLDGKPEAVDYGMHRFYIQSMSLVLNPKI
jgi:hypothetical protein